jgi:hypothetical protein
MKEIVALIVGSISLIGLPLSWFIYRRQKTDAKRVSDEQLAAAERVRIQERQEKHDRELSDKKAAFVRAVRDGMAAYLPRKGYVAIPDRAAPARAEVRHRGMEAVDAALGELRAFDPSSALTRSAEAVQERFLVLFVNAEGENHAERLEALRERLAALDPTT